MHERAMETFLFSFIYRTGECFKRVDTKKGKKNTIYIHRIINRSVLHHIGYSIFAREKKK